MKNATREPGTGRKIVALYASYERDRYSDFSLSELIRHLETRLPGAEIERIVLPERFRELPDGESLERPDRVIDEIGDSLLRNDLLLIGSPVYNLTYSPYLHVLFHRLRRRLVEFDSHDGDRVVGRHLKGVRAAMVLTCRSGRQPWMSIARFFVACQFSLTFRYWGGRVLGYGFIPGCQPDRLDGRREFITLRMEQLARRLVRRL